MSTITQVKERPITFSAEMVRRILANEKTQTRRVMKPKPYPLSKEANYVGVPTCEGDWAFPYGCGPSYRVSNKPNGPDNWAIDCPCPFGVPGDRLWVCERWGIEREDAHTLTDPEYLGGHNPDKIWYHAREKDPSIFPKGFWRSPIHMPRWASRLTLEITDVTPKLLQNNDWVWAITFKKL